MLIDNYNSLSVVNYPPLSNDQLHFPTIQFTSSPICCPSRASMLTGQYAHNHRTFNNSASGGCYSETWQKEIEDHTFPVFFKANGYNTFYGGKYLNQVEQQTILWGVDRSTESSSRSIHCALHNDIFKSNLFVFHSYRKSTDQRTFHPVSLIGMDCMGTPNITITRSMRMVF